ncbi:GDSL-like Lipase/Acylhydrolase [bacterium BMS3Bbin07]|nr:GDSL-like Lipase/Acylhydrolase [bacterium BMS3Bbin07]
MHTKDILFLGHSLIEFFDWQTRFPGHRVASLGVAGETVEGLLSRLDGIIKEYPYADLVFIMTGTNNVAMEDFDFLDVYREIIEKLSAAYPKAGIYPHSILPIMLEWITGEDIQRANQSIREMTGETRAGFLDIYKLFTDTEGKAVKDYFLEDGVHLSGEGYSVWTGALEKIVNR